MFGIDPVTGSNRPPGRDRAVDGGPEPLVSGEVDGSRYLLDARTPRCSSSTPTTAPARSADAARRLVGAVRQGGDASSAVRRTSSGRSATDEQLWLLQSRPVTTEIRGVPRRARSTARARSPRRSPSRSPSSSTTSGFRRSAKRSARRSCSRARRRRRRSTPARSSCRVDGHVAIDLRLAGEITPKRSAPAAS